MTCPHTGKWIGCRFEPRYDVGAAEVPDRKLSIQNCDVPAVFAEFRPKTYIHDICTRCGKVVERTQSKET